jgi:hypothetical protein
MICSMIGPLYRSISKEVELLVEKTLITSATQLNMMQTHLDSKLADAADMSAEGHVDPTSVMAEISSSSVCFVGFPRLAVL